MTPLSSPLRLGLTAAAHLLSPAGARASLLVLIYHRVLRATDAMLPSEPDAARFAAHMDLLASLFNVLPLGEAAERLARKALPARAVAITFDDGYANNLEIAAPLLAARKLPATVFVSTGFTGGGRMWNDTLIELVRAADSELNLSRFDLGVYTLDNELARRKAVDGLIEKLKYLEPNARLERVNAIAEYVGRQLPDDLMMSETQLRALQAQGFDIGAHTIHHPILTRLDDDAVRQEILGGKSRLEDILGKPITLFAYPNGRPVRDYEARHVRTVRACGFKAAVSTAWGAARADCDLFQIPRVAPWDKTAPRFAARLLKAYVGPAAQTV